MKRKIISNVISLTEGLRIFIMKGLNPSTLPPLVETEAHVWVVELNSYLDTLKIHESVLSAEELQRANKFYTKELYQKFVLSRGMLRFSLSKYLHILPQDVVFNYNENGKPLVEGAINFNVSHSKDLAIFAFTQNNWVGVDIEYKREIEQLIEICKRFLTAAECQQVISCPPNDRLNLFYNFWVKKEAYTKAVGGRLLEVLAKQKDADPNLEDANNFYTQLIHIKNNYASAISTRHPLKNISYFDY